MKPRMSQVGRVWTECQQVGNIDGCRVPELLQERWISVSGRMHTLRTYPAGAWRNKEVHERLRATCKLFSISIQERHRGRRL